MPTSIEINRDSNAELSKPIDRFHQMKVIEANTVFTASYVGNEGHRLVTSIEANPSHPALCLFLNNQNNLGPNSAGPCGPFSETPPFNSTTGVSTLWITASGQTIAAVRPLGPLFDTNPFVFTIANSRYNSLPISASHNTGSLSFLAGYTYSKCIDNASGLQDSTDPFDPRRSIALCNFDVTHNFVFSYNGLLPFDKLASSGWRRKVVGGWSLSGIVNFATGPPITLTENDDNALIGAGAVPVDVPNFAAGKVLAETNPRHGNSYFNTSLFSNEQLGQWGIPGAVFSRSRTQQLRLGSREDHQVHRIKRTSVARGSVQCFSPCAVLESDRRN